jgi:hypothetical protein
MSLLRMSLLRTVLFLISRLSIEPVATAKEVPPSATKSAIAPSVC